MTFQTKPQRSDSKPKKKTPRKITPSYLRNSGLFYLQRFPASSDHFRTVMLRKIKRSCNHHTDQDFDECTAMLDTLIESFITDHILDDQGYINGMINSLRRAGKSRKAIFARLMAKSVPSDKIESALKTYDEDNFEDPFEAEFLSALTFARKKRLGLFDNKEKYDFEKSLAILARQGFQYDTARKIMEIKREGIATLPEDAQRIIYSAPSFME